jgi:hypothetical protein
VHGDGGADDFVSNGDRQILCVLCASVVNALE